MNSGDAWRASQPWRDFLELCLVARRPQQKIRALVQRKIKELHLDLKSQLYRRETVMER